MVRFGYASQAALGISIKRAIRTRPAISETPNAYVLGPINLKPLGPRHLNRLSPKPLHMYIHTAHIVNDVDEDFI